MVNGDDIRASTLPLVHPSIHPSIHSAEADMTEDDEP
jgi:hypothetical protein